MATPDDRTGWRRLHPLSLLFRVGAAARRLLLPLLALVFVSRGGGTEVWLALLFVPATAAAIVGYLSYRYRLEPDELVIREGILTRNERHVPYARIQNVDLVQNLLQRWLGVAEARLETASGSEPEAVMRVLSLAEVATVRERVFRDSRPIVDAGSDREPAAEPLHRTRALDLVILGLTSNRGLAVVAAAFGALWQLEPFGYDPESLVRRIARMDPSRSPLPISPGGATLVAVLGFLSVVVLLKMLSVAWTMIRLHGFVLEARGDDLSSRYGLLTRVTATVPLRRIQHLAIRRGPLERWLGRASIRIETAGHGGGRGRDGEGGTEVERLWLAPSIAERDVAALVARVLPGVALADADWRSLAPLAGRRILRRGLAVTLLAGAAALAALGPRSLWLLVPVVALVTLHARRWPRNAGYALLPDAAVWRSGFWVRRTSIVPYEKVQVVELRESPFDRRHGMASVALDTAGAGRVDHAFAVPYLERDRAVELEGRVAAETSARAFRW